MNHWPYSKGFIKFGYLGPSKIMFDFWIFLVERRLTQFVRVPLMTFWYFWWSLFFRWNEITLWRKKHTTLFQTRNWEKSCFFNTHVRVFARLYTNTWQVGHRVNRVKTWIPHSLEYGSDVIGGFGLLWCFELIFFIFCKHFQFAWYYHY